MKIRIILFSFCLVCLPFGTWAQSTLPGPLQRVDVQQLLNAQVPLDVPFKNETGNEVTIGGLLRDKPAMLTLVYYECPMLCTQVLNGLITSLRPLTLSAGNEFDIFTISFDPDETPKLAAAKKETYLKQYSRSSAKEGWHFLTGNEKSIQHITKAVGFQYSYDPKSDQFAHASVIMVMTPEGKVARYFYGIDYSSRDLRWALVDASENKIGSFSDKILLYCFHYDPTVGKYTARALNLIRLGGIATVLLLGGFILKMRRKESAKNHV